VFAEPGVPATPMMMPSMVSVAGGVSQGAQAFPTLAIADIEKIRAEAQLVTEVSPVVVSRSQVVRKRAQVLNALMSTRETSDPAVVEDQVARLLLMLQRDGYLLESAGRYAFRSFLLREYWHRREVR